MLRLLALALLFAGAGAAGCTPERGCDADCGAPPDGASVDGGAADLAHDGALPDGGGGDLASAPCPDAAFFCEGFESGAFDNWAEESPSMGTVTLAAGHGPVHSGAWAADATVPGAAGSQFLSRFVSGVKSVLAARFWVWASAPPPGTRTSLLRLDDAIEVTLAFASQEGVFSIWDGVLHPGSTVIKPGAWHCVELVVTAGSGVDLYVDGKAEVSYPRTLPIPTEMDFGVVYTPGSPMTLQYGFDDLALAYARLPCP